MILHLMIADHEIAGDSSELRSTAQGSQNLDNNIDNVKQLETMKKNRAIREAISREKGIVLPFDDIARGYGLDAFERDILILLFVFATSSTIRALFEKSIFSRNRFKMMLEAGHIISILEQDFANQIKRRKYFSIKARLIKNEIIMGSNDRYDPSESIIEQDFCVHQRIVNHILGDHNVYTRDMSCIERVHSTVSIDKLVLLGNQKNDIIEKVSSYIKGAKRRSDLKVSSHFGYGTGMACLFHGPSGTGKTMLAHCLANHLRMDLLMVSLGNSERMTTDDIIKYAFKEARLTDSIIFFDECDDAFEVDTEESRILLVELEKSECITILATNKPVKLDPAMNRRIQLKVPFIVPGMAEQEKIWQKSIPEGVQIEDNVDFKKLTAKYYFSGGLIKNALMEAINAAISMSGDEDILLTREIIENAANTQSQNLYQHDIYGDCYTPDCSIDNLSLNNTDKNSLRHLAACESTGIIERQGGGTLLVTSDVTPAINALEAVAVESHRKVRKYSLSGIFEKKDESFSLINPFTQEPMKSIELPFLPLTGNRSIIVLVDDNDRYVKELIKTDQNDDEYLKFLTLLATSKQHLYIVTTFNPTETQVPGIRRVVRIGCPPETEQLDCWQKNLNGHTGTQNQLFDLVEHYPLYPFQIDRVCKEARIRSIIQHGNDERMFMFVEEVIKGRYGKHPVLFGGG